MSEKMIAYCGITCTECPAYKATLTDNDDLRRSTSREWSQMFNADIPPESINCQGCRSDSEIKFFHCQQCAIRSCAGEKGIATCAECADYPCDPLRFVIDNVPEARAVLEAIKAKITR